MDEGKEVIFTNVGNPHGLGQKPITFIRHVMALVSAPDLMEKSQITMMVKVRASLRRGEGL